MNPQKKALENKMSDKPKMILTPKVKPKMLLTPKTAEPQVEKIRSIKKPLKLA